MDNFAASSPQPHLNAKLVLLFHTLALSHKLNAFLARTANTVMLTPCKTQLALAQLATTAQLAAHLLLK